MYFFLNSSPNSYALFLPILNVVNKDKEEVEETATILLIFLVRKWRKLKNKGAMYSTQKRRNEKNVDLFVMSQTHLLMWQYIRYDTLRKALRRAEDAMHALILIYVYRTSHFSRIIFRTRDFLRTFFNDTFKTFIIFELSIIKKE